MDDVMDAVNWDAAYLFQGDCLSAMRGLLADGHAGQVHAVVTDPPYGIGFGGEKWDSPDNIAFRSEVWRLAYDLLAPGGHLVAFASARTYHRLATAVESAGFEIRDQLMWLYGTGTAVERDLSIDVDRLLGETRELVQAPWSNSMGNTKARHLERPGQLKARELGYKESPICQTALKSDPHRLAKVTPSGCPISGVRDASFGS